MQKMIDSCPNAVAPEDSLGIKLHTKLFQNKSALFKYLIFSMFST